MAQAESVDIPSKRHKGGDMRIHANRWGTVALIAATLALMAASPVFAVVDIDDPDLFGPNEGWAQPVALGPGDSGPWVVRLQERLTESGFRPGTADGVFGKATLGAVYAFQKVHELPRDGIFRTEHWDLLEVDVGLPETTASPDRVEVDLERQVLLLVRDSEVEVVLPISSGNGEIYAGRGGRPTRARTPEGSYSFYRHVSGWRISYLGGLYNPFYFRGGYAIHGSSSVPPYPASHGCVRVEIHDMDFLKTQLTLGMPIYVYGNAIARSDLLPEPPPPEPDESEPLPTIPFDQVILPALI